MISRGQILKKLNWFYTLESNQVDLYNAQSKLVDDIYLQRTLARVAIIEQQHIDNIADKIKELGGKPSLIGDLIAPLVGKISGQVIGRSGITRMLKANITLEEKAMTDYKDFILNVGQDHDLFDLLWSNLIDEDLHSAWFANKLEHLKSIK